jgi:hypothetical protein
MFQMLSSYILFLQFPFFYNCLLFRIFFLRLRYQFLDTMCRSLIGSYYYEKLVKIETILVFNCSVLIIFAILYRVIWNNNTTIAEFNIANMVFYRDMCSIYSLRFN